MLHLTPPRNPGHCDREIVLDCMLRIKAADQLCVLQDARRGSLEPRRLVGKHHAAFEPENPTLVDHCRTARDQPVAYTMDRLQDQLIVRLAMLPWAWL
jgi:hypothetical protein